MAGFIGRCAERLISHQAGRIASTLSTETQPICVKVMNTYAEVVAGGALAGGVAGVFTAVDKGREILHDKRFCFREKLFFAPIGIPLSCAIYGLGGAMIGGAAAAFFPITICKMRPLHNLR